MSWFSEFFKKQDDFEVEYKDIPASTLLRWYIYDTSLADENGTAEFMGLSRVSQEGDEKEREDSDRRLIDSKFLFPYIDYISSISSDVVTSVQLKDLADSTDQATKALSEELAVDLEVMRKVYKAVAASTLLGAFSIALHVGLIHAGTVVLSETDEGDIYE